MRSTPGPLSRHACGHPPGGWRLVGRGGVQGSEGVLRRAWHHLVGVSARPLRPVRAVRGRGCGVACNRGLQGVRASSGQVGQMVWCRRRMVSARKVNSSSFPAHARLAVLPARTSCIGTAASVMNASRTSSAAGCAWGRAASKHDQRRCGGQRHRDAEHSRLADEQRDLGLQAQALAYQSASRVVEVWPPPA